MPNKPKTTKRARPGRARGQVITKGPNKYLVRVYLGKDPKGKRKYNAQLVTGGRRDADKALTATLRELDTHMYVEPSRATLAAYLDTWLESIKNSVAERTWEDYRGRLVRDVVPALGQRQIATVGAADIQRLYNDLVAKGLSARTVRYTHAILSRALRKAASERVIRFNPTEGVNLPRGNHREMLVLTHDQVNQLFGYTATTDPLHALWVLLVTCGLRPGEALALRWSDVEIEGKVLRIVRALKKGSGDRYFIGDPKTAGSRRTVTMPDMTTTALQQHRARQAAEILQAGRKYARNDLVFANSVGAPWDIAKIRRRFSGSLKGAGVPRVRLYDTRHTCATLLLSARTNPKVVSERLGHTNIGITLNTYSHVLPHMQTEAADTMDRLLMSAVM